MIIAETLLETIPSNCRECGIFNMGHIAHDNCPINEEIGVSEAVDKRPERCPLKETESLMSRGSAYRTIAKHIFVAHQMYSSSGQCIIILADSFAEAENKAKIDFGSDSVYVKRIIPTEDAQLYKIGSSNFVVDKAMTDERAQE